MKINKKLILSTLVFQAVGAIVFTVLFLLTYFDIINKNYILVNGIIFAILAVVPILWYTLVRKKYCNSFDIGDLVLLLIILTAFYAPMLLVGMQKAGVHLSVTLVWMGAALLIFANNTIKFLQEKDDFEDYKDKKYTYIISKLKIWRVCIVVVSCLFGITNIFIPFDITLFNFH